MIEKLFTYEFPSEVSLELVAMFFIFLFRIALVLVIVFYVLLIKFVINKLWDMYEKWRQD